MLQLRSLFVGVALGLVGTAGASVQGWLPLDQADVLVTRAQQEAYTVDALAAQVADPGLRHRLRVATGRLDLQLTDLQLLVDQVQATPPRAQPPRHAPVPAVVVTHTPRAGAAAPGRPHPAGLRRMGDAELSGLLATLQAETWADQKLALLSSASRGRRFTTDQVVRVMGQFTFGDDQVDAAAMLYPSVVDPHRWYTVYGALTFGSDKDDLRARTEG